MTKRHLVFALAMLPAALAGGCGQAELPPAGPEFLPREDVAEPLDSWGEYVAALATAGTPRSNVDQSSRRSITVEIPAGWRGDGPVWRRGESKLDHLRVAYLKGSGPETEWSKQQQLDEHRVVKAEKIQNGYLLMVNHPGLKASILKFFIIDPTRQDSAFYFLECRAAYDGDRTAVWSACKGAVESAKFEAVQ